MWLIIIFGDEKTFRDRGSGFKTLNTQLVFVRIRLIINWQLHYNYYLYLSWINFSEINFVSL